MAELTTSAPQHVAVDIKPSPEPMGKKQGKPPLLPPFVTAAAEPVAIKTVVFIFNPVSGGGKGKKLAEKIVIPMLKEAGVEVKVMQTERANHAEEIARTADLTGIDALVVQGGDGTCSECVTGYLQRAEPATCPLGFVPGGTGNTYLHEALGVKTAGSVASGVRTAVGAILGGRTRRVDAQRVSFTALDGSTPATRYAINTVAAGFAAEVNEVAEKRRWMGPLRYSISVKTGALGVPCRKAMPASLTVDGGAPIRMDDVFLFACHINKFTGVAHRLCPKAQLDDGILDLIYTNRPLRSIIKVAQLDEAVKGGGRHIHHPACTYHQLGKASFEPDTPSKIMIDGDIRGVTPLNVEVAPNAFALLTLESPSPT